MDSDSDEGHEQAGDDGRDNSDHLVTVKSHFEGKAGEEVLLVVFADFVASWNLQPYVNVAEMCCIAGVVNELNTKFL